MELLCLKCRRLVEEDPCPFCGSAETREPVQEDACYLAEMDSPRAALLAGTLEKAGIPFRVQTSRVGKIKLFRVFYVPYDRLEDAWSEVQRLWGEDQPASAVPGEDPGPELFSGDEIDRMEAAGLDDMDLEELKAYRSRIIRTLKAIRIMEQKWKERSNILLDMKEEAEYLIDDRS